jgi:hypothetical protein
MNPSKIPVYLEFGKRRTFAAALDWYGWCRVGRDEDSALKSLFEYAPRYASIVNRSRLGFRLPAGVSDFTIVQRLQGNATTDFGAPDIAPKGDATPIGDDELHRLVTILRACWRAFDAEVKKAKGKRLRTGPRGGGRSVDKIVEHVLGAENAYLYSLGGRGFLASTLDPSQREIRDAILKTLPAAARGEVEKKGPRGGKRWSPRYFARRDAWHILDHLWEIQDRAP